MKRNASLFSTHGSPVAQDPPLAGMEQNCTKTKNDENVAMGQNGYTLGAPLLRVDAEGVGRMPLTMEEQ